MMIFSEKLLKIELSFCDFCYKIVVKFATILS